MSNWECQARWAYINYMANEDIGQYVAENATRLKLGGADRYIFNDQSVLVISGDEVNYIPAPAKEERSVLSGIVSLFGNFLLH